MAKFWSLSVPTAFGRLHRCKGQKMESKGIGGILVAQGPQMSPLLGSRVNHTGKKKCVVGWAFPRFQASVRVLEPFPTDKRDDCHVLCRFISNLKANIIVNNYIKKRRWGAKDTTRRAPRGHAGALFLQVLDKVCGLFATRTTPFSGCVPPPWI